MPKGDTSLRVQYEELSWSLRQVENLTVLLPRLLSDTSGHYLVLFESAAYQEKLGTELEQLLRTVDPAVRFYAADHACFADSAAVETFLSDTAPGPKVLLCVNAPGVQQPLEGLAGVILVRQSSLMSTFKQMLCRALVAAGSRSVPVFDLVAQFEGLGNGRTLQRDCTEAMTRAGSKTPGFRQERPMQQTYRLYGKLRREMEARWEVLCQAAADASAKEGTLELPRSYTIHSGVPVGKWLELQRQVQAGQRPGRLTAEQAAKLEKLGIRWNHRLEAAWEKGFASAQKYRTEHGDLLVPVRYRDKNDFALGEWIVYNRQRYLGGNLTQNASSGWKPSAWCGAPPTICGSRTMPPPPSIIWNTAIWKYPSSVKHPPASVWGSGWGPSAPLTRQASCHRSRWSGWTLWAWTGPTATTASGCPCTMLPPPTTMSTAT